MDNYLKRQIEKISDETHEERFSVIVQVRASDELRRHLDQASEVLERRRAVVSARDLLSELDRTPGAGSERTASVKRAAPKRGTPTKLDLGGGSIGALVKSRWFADMKRTPGNAGTPAVFHDTGSAVLEVTKDDLSRLLHADSGVGHVYPNRRVRVPPTSKSVALPRAVSDSPGYTWGLARTGAMACWGAFGATGEGIRVAILDTGADRNHADIKGKIGGFAQFDRSGRVVVDDAGSAKDGQGHGTHCAGIVAGGSASGRHIGMAPKASLLIGCVLPNGEGTDAQILAGIEWAIKNKAHVISMSLGGLSMTADVLDTYTRPIISANQAGIPVVVAVGNEGSQTTGSPGNDFFAFTVGATDVDDRAAGFSGGRTQIIENSSYIDSRYLPLVYSKPDISAPGVDIFSSVPGGKHEAWSGTSMATPHVAGAIALLLSAGTPLLKPKTGQDLVDALQTLLVGTVIERGEAGQNHRFGYGRMDVLRAMGIAHE